MSISAAAYTSAECKNNAQTTPAVLPLEDTFDTMTNGWEFVTVRYAMDDTLVPDGPAWHFDISFIGYAGSEVQLMYVICSLGPTPEASDK